MMIDDTFRLFECECKDLYVDTNPPSSLLSQQPEQFDSDLELCTKSSRPCSVTSKFVGSSISPPQKKGSNIQSVRWSRHVQLCVVCFPPSVLICLLGCLGKHPKMVYSP